MTSTWEMAPGKMYELLVAKYPLKFDIPSETEIKTNINVMFQSAKNEEKEKKKMQLYRQNKKSYLKGKWKAIASKNILVRKEVFFNIYCLDLFVFSDDYMNGMRNITTLDIDVLFY